MTTRQISVPYQKMTQYEPWAASAEDKEAQIPWQQQLRETGDVDFGEDCFISTESIFIPGHFRCGDKTWICGDALIRGDVEMGSDCSVNPFTVLAGTIRIGDQVRIASNSSLFGFNHGHEDTDRPICSQKHTSKGITIKDDVWIGANVVVVDGVTVGAHSILAAGAVVTKDVPPYSIMGGNPARRLRDRRSPGKKGHGLKARLKEFGEKVRQEHAAVLDEAFDETQGYYVDNQQNREPTDRAWCDAVEIAGCFDTVPLHVSREELIQTLQGLQNPDTGCFDQDLQVTNPTPLQRVEHNGYHYLCVGYALEVLGSHLFYKNQQLEHITAEALINREKELPWQHRAWSGGSWNDHLGTAAYHDLKYHEGSFDLSTQFGWLNLHCSPSTGLWGEPTTKQRWLQPVNGFYRLTRGTYAQFGQPLPYPEEAIDTILTHCRQYDFFLKDQITACNVLDVVHPLWLCSKQTDHRKAEIEKVMAEQLNAIPLRWIPNRGFGFKPASEPGLQGTEMWLSILYIAADFLDIQDTLGYRPKGVHRTDVALNL